MSTPVILSLGSNLGDRMKNLEQACILIQQEVGKILKRSSLYETTPWEMEESPLFLNQVIQVETPLLPLSLLHGLQNIEQSLGRNPKSPIAHRPSHIAHRPSPIAHPPSHIAPYSSRPLDIDILYYGDAIIETEDLRIPHPLIPFRNFILIPLCEINPKGVDPLSRKTFTQLLKRCTDQGSVTKIP